MKLLVLLFTVIGVPVAVTAQNLSINILVRNSGKVNINETVFLEVTVCNTDATVPTPVYQLKPQFSVPATVHIPATGHVLPSGWTISANKGSQIWLSNGTDTISAGECRTVLIALQGIKAGPAATVSGNLLFSNGKAPGSVTGRSTPGDSPADNSSTSTVEVLK